MAVAGTAGGGQEAVAMAKKERPHVILMDINMPDMDGITATEIISNTVPESPLIMMSVQGEQDYLRRSMLAGAREFPVKPLSAAELIDSIRHVPELEKVRRARYAYIVVDTWPSFQEQVITMLDVADVILTLMTLEITSLKNVRVFMEIVEKLGYGEDKVQLVANRNDSSGGIKASDVEASLG